MALPSALDSYTRSLCSVVQYSNSQSGETYFEVEQQFLTECYDELTVDHLSFCS